MPRRTKATTGSTNNNFFSRRKLSQQPHAKHKINRTPWMIVFIIVWTNTKDMVNNSTENTKEWQSFIPN